MAGLVPAIPMIGYCAILIEIAGTNPAMTPRVLLLLRATRAVTKAFYRLVNAPRFCWIASALLAARRNA